MAHGWAKGLRGLWSQWVVNPFDLRGFYFLSSSW